MPSKLKEKMIKLLKEDIEFRYTVAGLIGLDEILKRLDKHEERFIEILKRLDKHDERFIQIFERLDRHEEELVRLREDMNKGFELVERHISALGARWGIMAEDAFREGIKGLIEKEFNFKIEKWKEYDNEGFVYGYPSLVEIDIAIKDEKIILIEIKSHIRSSDVSIFNRKSIFYERKTNKKPYRLLMITPYADEDAINASKNFQIEIYTKV
ncbi:MAG: DUF3782 domain-containing protein [Nitrososphaerota archaeon]